MAYLKFNKDELVNLEYSLKREVLATNRAGGYMLSLIHILGKVVKRKVPHKPYCKS